MTNLLAKPNSALIQDELLYEIVRVLAGAKPAGPCFVSSLSSLVEACVIHEDVFILPAREASGTSTSNSAGVDSVVDGSALVSLLRSENVLQAFPSSKVLDPFLIEVADEGYDYIDFTSDLRWTLTSMAGRDSDHESALMELERMVIETDPHVFEIDELTDAVGEKDDVPAGPEAQRLVADGMDVKTLLFLESWNRQVGGLAKMARYLGLNLYVVPNAVPHLLGAVGATNTKARLQYDKITKYMSQSLNEDVGRSSFLSVKVPPLAIRTVEECRKDPEALGDVIVTMRERHAKLRAGLSDFDAHWTSATSYSDRIRLESDFRHAMEELVKRTTAPKDRWIYKTWSVVSSLDPTKILQRLGDRLVVMGRREAVIGQVRGLDAFWRDMLAAPPASTRAVIKNIVPRQADEPVWAAARGLASAVDKALASGAWKGG